MSKLWSIPIISVYLYGITILAQYGYNSYFGIPSSLIDSSIAQNFVYFFQLFQLASAIAGVMKWWMWLILVAGAVIIFFFHASNKFWRFVISTFGVFLFCYFLYGSHGFGQLIAKHTTEFYTPAEGCAALNPELKYIIPTFYQDKAVVVSINEYNILHGDVSVMNLAKKGCSAIRQNVGLIKQK